jgi:hypothetical protein
MLTFAVLDYDAQPRIERKTSAKSYYAAQMEAEPTIPASLVPEARRQSPSPGWSLCLMLAARLPDR